MGRRPRCSSVTSRPILIRAKPDRQERKMGRDAPLMPVRLGPPCRRPILIATIYLLFRGQDTRRSSTSKTRFVGALGIPRGGYANWLTAQPCGNVLNRIAIKYLVRILGYEPYVRRREYVIQRAERMRFRKRFDVINIEGGAGDRAALQCVDQRGFIDQWSARGVDEISARSHQIKLGCADNAFCAAAQNQMNGDDVCVPE